MLTKLSMLTALELLEKRNCLQWPGSQRQITCSIAMRKRSPLLQSRLIRIESDTVQIDPQLLFQRLIIVCNRSDDLEELFLHELCSYREALFDSPQTLRQPQTDQFLQTPYGQSCHLMPSQGQLAMFSMYWMVEFYSIEFHGLKSPQPIRIYKSVDYTAAMRPRSTETLSFGLVAMMAYLQKT